MFERNVVTFGHQLAQLSGSVKAALEFSHPKIAEGKIIRLLAKMMGITPAWFTRSGR